MSTGELLEDIYALTPSQQLMLLHCVANPDDRTMIQQFSCTIRGTLDVRRFRAAWHDVVSRHAILRTGFVWERVSKPYQFVTSCPAIRWCEHDLRDHFPGSQEEAFEELVLADRLLPMSLSEPPLMRIGIVSLSDSDTRLIWSCHHLVLDGWSVPIVLGEVFAIYESRRTGREPFLPRPFAFRDYLEWLPDQDLTLAQQYWQQRLAGYEPVHAFRIAARTPEQWIEHRSHIPYELSNCLEQAARQARITTTSIAVAAWGLVVAYLHGRQDIVFGLAVSGRPADLIGATQIVGPMTNTLPVRIGIDSELAISAWLGAIHEQLAELTAFEHVSLNQVARWHSPTAGMGLFDTLLVVENYPIDIAKFDDASIKVEEIHGTATSAFPITVVLLPGETWELRIRSHATIVSTEYLAELDRAFCNALRHLIETPASPLGDWTCRLSPSILDHCPAERSNPSVTHCLPGETERFPPRDDIERQLVRIWQELLQRDDVGVRDNFMELGGDSVLAVNMLALVDQHFGKQLPIAALFHEPTIEHLAERIRSVTESGVESLLVPLRPGTDNRPLFCVHPAGGTVFCYQNLVRHLQGNYPVFGLQAVGLDGCRPPQTEVREMAAEYIGAIRGQQPSGPYAICGWSSGGVLAFDIARQLEPLGERVDTLVLFDAAIPNPEEEFSVEDFLPMLLLMFPSDSPEELNAIQQLPAEEQLEFFRERAEFAHVVTEKSARAQVRYVYEIFKANMNAMTTYVPAVYHGPLHLYRTRSESTPMHRQISLGWDPYVEDLRIHYVDGDHISMFTEPYIGQLANRVNELLANRCEPAAYLSSGFAFLED